MINILSADFWENLTFENYLIILVAANFLMYFFTALIVYSLRRFFIHFDLNFKDNKMSRRDYLLSLYVLIANISVGILGWYMMKKSYITLEEKPMVYKLLDILLVIFLVDWSMYVAHFITHKTFLYKLTHSVHHEHESMGTLSLFVMHPMESLGFGVILISILSVFSIDITALLIFLFLNWILGVFAHSGIEPSKGFLANYICMTRFHQIHHENPKCNFGFYTPFLDMVFRTRKYQLKKEILKN
jgi:sterol desaturase/sphingolipid hydroxylase (fatty acid hydroxylase superfamily)